MHCTLGPERRPHGAACLHPCLRRRARADSGSFALLSAESGCVLPQNQPVEGGYHGHRHGSGCGEKLLYFFSCLVDSFSSVCFVSLSPILSLLLWFAWFLVLFLPIYTFSLSLSVSLASFVSSFNSSFVSSPLTSFDN